MSSNFHESAHVHTILDVIKKCCIEIGSLIRQGDSESMGKDMHIINRAGDEVIKLDLIANDILKEHLLECEYVRVIGSEEEQSLVPSEDVNAPYLVCFDPLDGSSNIDVNITVGTIFAVYKYNHTHNGDITNGRDIVMAGYCLYGGSTQLVVSDCFSKQTKMYSLYKNEDFVLMEPNLKIPQQGSIYAVNESNKHKFTDKRMNAFIEWCISNKYTTRWVGSLVADAHRTLIKGGFFSYPGNITHKQGKLRLLYEVYPFAYIFEMSGGTATSISTTSSSELINVLDIPFPHDNPHLKCPLYLSSVNEMNIYSEL